MNKSTPEKISFWTTIAVTVVVVIIAGVSWSAFSSTTPAERPSDSDSTLAIENLPTLPAPEVSDGLRGTFGIDKNINESTLDQYLHRPDVIYRDMRMLKDPGNYEAIGGDSYLSGFVDGFEVVPYPYLVNVTGLPVEVGDSYTGKTLFTQSNDGGYIANYVESMQILKDLFPQDKTIFLMCGGGGYAGMTKDLLVKLGWDANKIYNVGGYWHYEGKNNVPVRTTRNGATAYDFWKVPYHNIDFSTLHALDNQITQWNDPTSHEVKK